MLQQIEEACSLGAHASVIVPPSWIIRVRKPQVQSNTRSHASPTFNHVLLPHDSQLTHPTPQTELMEDKLGISRSMKSSYGNQSDCELLVIFWWVSLQQPFTLMLIG